VWLTLALTLAWSWVATWALALAGQAFPSDTIMNPLVEYALPNWLAGNIARNAGTIVLGLRGPLSILPLVAVLAAGVGLLALLGRSADGRRKTGDGEQPNGPAPEAKRELQHAAE
jgi:hypothetical protein